MRLIDADETYKHIAKSAAFQLTKAYRNSSTAEARGMKMAADMVNEAPTIDNWIKIDPNNKETLPETDNDVLVLLDDYLHTEPRYDVARYLRTSNEWVIRAANPHAKILEWMTIPTPKE
jgi:hypothetical protein